MAQWWERSPPTSVARVRFPDSALLCGLSLLLVLVSALRDFLPPQKATFPNSNSAWNIRSAPTALWCSMGKQITFTCWSPTGLRPLSTWSCALCTCGVHLSHSLRMASSCFKPCTDLTPCFSESIQQQTLFTPESCLMFILIALNVLAGTYVRSKYPGKPAKSGDELLWIYLD